MPGCLLLCSEDDERLCALHFANGRSYRISCIIAGKDVIRSCGRTETAGTEGGPKT